MAIDASGRRVRPHVRLLGVLAIFALLVAACGDDGDDDAGGGGTTTTGANGDGNGGDGAPDDLDPDGVFEFLGPDFTLTLPKGFDPTQKNAPGEVYDELIYGTLLRRTGDGVYHDGLASASQTRIVDPSTIEVELLPGQTYTDGTPLTADNVADVIARNARLGLGGNMRIGQLAALKDQSGEVAADALVVNGPTSLTINLTMPIAGGFYDLLAHEESGPYLIPDVGLELGDEGYDEAVGQALQDAPIGAGPYMVESFTPNDKLVLVKNEGYVHADMIRIPTVIFNHNVADGRLTALNAGRATFTASNLVEAEQVTRDGYSYEAVPNPDKFGWLWTVCMGPLIPGETDGTAVRDPLPNGDPHPLTIPEVRQALNHALDKEELIARFFPGLPEGSVPVMDQLWQNDSPFANPDLVDSYPYDPDRAIELFEEAGVDPEDVQLTFFTVPGASQTTGELLQQQWAEIGVELVLQPSTDVLGDFFYGRSIDFYGNLAGASARWFTDKVTRNWTSGTGATCNPSVEAIGGDPAILDMLTELNGMEPGSDETIPLWQDIAEIIIEGAFGIFLSWPPDILLAEYERLGVGSGEPFTADYSQLWPAQQGTMNADLHQLYIKQG